MTDRDLSYRDIQALNGQDAVAAFFAMLGYETSFRVEQSPAALGITAESLATQIRHIELIANQEDLLYVYLFELASVTLTATRAIARGFRARAGNYLLVLADDYDHLDFVLLEKSLPLPGAPGSLSQKQVSIRPRPLSVNRRNPDRIHLRVLRRFAYSEPDPIAQYQKLCSAYTVAEWSEDFFNNRALFSDYFLKERVPSEYAEWREDPRPVFQEFQSLYTQPSARWSGKTRSELEGELLEPAFRLLDYTTLARNGEREEKAEADYGLYAHDGRTLLALCLTYPWNRSLDGKDDKDPERSEENPAAAVVSLLQREEINWALVTNGKLWRLYSAKTHSRATNYYEIDLEEVMAERGTLADDPSTAFRYFWLFFRRQALEPPTPFLNRILEGSEEYSKALGERLKERVFEEIFPHFAEGFIEWIRRKEGHESDLPRERLDQIFQGTLTFLYRLLFLLYAEARDLLPVKETRGYWEKSLTRLKREIADAAGNIDGESETKLKVAYRTDSTTLYDRLTALFRTIDQGEAAINVPVYNGGLFLTTPDTDDASPEAQIARFLLTNNIPDRHLALGLDRLTRDVDEKSQALVFIDYKSLGVRQLGSIYEGLLEFKLRVAQEKMAVVKGKRTEEVVPYREAVSQKLKILTEGRGKDATERIYAKGRVYLENDRRERKATGSYYTPDDIVQYIVRHTVGPVLEEKFEALRPRLREAQKLYREAIQAKAEFERRRMTPPDPERRALRAFQEKFRINLMDEFFDLNVLDPAMGSGHFLVEVVDFITDRVLDFLNAFPWNPILAYLKQTRETILREMDEQGVSIDQSRLTDVNLLKRHVLKRCIYGVDLNPMAVELAKVSLWLDCFTLGAPLSFLDHHLRSGNSVVGVSVREVQEALHEEQMTLFGSRFAGLLLATDLMRHVGELADVTSAQVKESRAEYRRATDALAPFKRILDIYTSQWFDDGDESRTGRKGKRAADPPALVFLKSREAETFIQARDGGALRKGLNTLPPDDRRIAETALRAAVGSCFFHWELEFPEVYYRPRGGTGQVIERLEAAGFDVVVGNPPWGGTLDESIMRWIRSHYEGCSSGLVDTFAVFIELGIRQLRDRGRLGLLLPDIFLLKNYPQIRSHVLHQTSIESLVHWGMPFPDVNLDVCSILTRKGSAPKDHTIRCVPEVQHNDPDVSSANIIPQRTFLEAKDYRLNLMLSEDLVGLLKRVRGLGPRMDELFLIREGVHSGNVRDRLFLEQPVGKQCEKLLFGRDEIRPLILEWHGKWIQLDTKALGSSKDGYFNLGDPQLHRARKILVRRTGDRVIAALDSVGLFSSNNFFLCVPNPPLTWEEVCYCAAVLNTPFVTWYFRAIQPRAGRLFAELKITHLSEIPIPFVRDPEYATWVQIVGGTVDSIVRAPGGSESCVRFLDEFSRELEDRIRRVVPELKVPS